MSRVSPYHDHATSPTRAKGARKTGVSPPSKLDLDGPYLVEHKVSADIPSRSLRLTHTQTHPFTIQNDGKPNGKTVQSQGSVSLIALSGILSFDVISVSYRPTLLFSSHLALVQYASHGECSLSGFDIATRPRSFPFDSTREVAIEV